MKPVFGITREQKNELFIYDYSNLSGEYFHFHSLVEIILVREGSVDACVGEKSRRISKGEIAVAAPFEAHSFHAAGEVRATILFIPLYLCEEFWSAMKNKKLTDPFFSGEDAARIRECFDALSHGELLQIEKIGFIYLILGRVLKKATTVAAENSADADLGSKLLFYINENFRDELSLDKIAYDLGYSANYISKNFRATFKIGIKQYITTVRLKNAVILLRDEKHSVTECALDSGFPSVRNFYRAFSAEFGCSPREYLKREDI